MKDFQAATERQDQSVSPCALSKEELEQHLRARAWKDDAFRQEFLADPTSVLERDYAQYFPEGKIPSELSIKVVEEEEQSIYFVLPPKSSDQLLEIDNLNDEELLEVNGGITWDCSARATCPSPTFCPCDDLRSIRKLGSKFRV
jgi:hypothetical protein